MEIEKYRLKRDLPGLRKGSIISKFNNRWYHDEFDRIRLSREIVEENSKWFEKVEPAFE